MAKVKKKAPKKYSELFGYIDEAWIQGYAKENLKRELTKEELMEAKFAFYECGPVCDSMYNAVEAAVEYGLSYKENNFASCHDEIEKSENKKEPDHTFTSDEIQKYVKENFNMTLTEEEITKSFQSFSGADVDISDHITNVVHLAVRNIISGK